MDSPSKIASLMTDADAAYDAEDDTWFETLPTADLTALWGVACANLACANPSGASWDDEVHDALYVRGWFDTDDDTKQAEATTIYPRPSADAQCDYCDTSVAFEVAVSGITRGKACRAHVGDLAGNIAKGKS